MRTYPAYTAQAALHEYAITFFSLLNKAYKSKHEHYLMMARIEQIPYMSNEQRKTFIKSLEYASKDADDILRLRSEGTNIGDVKRVLGG